jgi:hypothetical protein
LILGDPILACFDVQRERRLLDELACDQDGTTTGAMLARRNGRSLAIRGSLGENVVLVSPATVDRLPRLVELRERYPSGSAVVAFSAPIYPKAGVAAVYYRAFNEGLGVVCLVHNENRWSVHTRKHLVE